MKRSTVLATLGGASLLLTVGFLYQCGPVGLHSGAERTLSSISLSQTRQISITARKTGNFIDAFEVRLYDRDGTNLFVCYLGHQEAYWWGTSLRVSPTSGSIDIRAFWRREAVYNLNTRSVTWSQGNRPMYPSYKVNAILPARINGLLVLSAAKKNTPKGGGKGGLRPEHWIDTLTSNCRPFLSIPVFSRWSRLLASLEKFSLNISPVPLL